MRRSNLLEQGQASSEGLCLRDEFASAKPINDSAPVEFCCGSASQYFAFDGCFEIGQSPSMVVFGLPLLLSIVGLCLVVVFKTLPF
jgi:hypothetical protein